MTNEQRSFSFQLMERIVIHLIKDEMTRRSEEVGSKILQLCHDDDKLHYRTDFNGHRFYRKNEKVLTYGDAMHLMLVYVKPDKIYITVQQEKKSKTDSRFKARRISITVSADDGMSESIKDQLTGLIDFYFQRVKNFYTEDFETTASKMHSFSSV